MIFGNRIILGPIEAFHLQQMVNWRNDPELRQHFREYRVLTYEHQKRWWEEKVLKDPSWEYFTIRLQEQPDMIIGACGLTYIHPVNRTGEFAIFMGNKEFRKEEFISDSINTLVKYGFDFLNLNRIWGEVYSNNPLLSIYLKVGFKEEGVLRETYFNDGKYWNSHVISILNREYKERKINEASAF